MLDPKLIKENPEIIRNMLKSRAVKFDLDSTKSQRLLDICKKLNATTYISGEIGKDYLDEKIFHESGIEIIYEKFQHPIYRQNYGEFVSHLSILDLLFNEGRNSRTILLNSKNI